MFLKRFLGGVVVEDDDLDFWVGLHSCLKENGLTLSNKMI